MAMARATEDETATIKPVGGEEMVDYAKKKRKIPLVTEEPPPPPPSPRRSKRIRAQVGEGREGGETTGHEKWKQDEEKKLIKLEEETTDTKNQPPAKGKKMKIEEKEEEIEDTKKGTAADLQAKKLKSYTRFAGLRQSPFPDFHRPTGEECKLAYGILSTLHGGERRQPPDKSLPPVKVKEAPSNRAGCGDSPSVLDALIRTILSQNTSDANSSRAKLSMDRVYGRSDAWDAVVAGGPEKLRKAIESGGLAAVKSRVIIDILDQTRERYGTYSLDHLFNVSDDEAMRQLLAFRGVGPKTASCVLLFCLQRASFAVDTHVHRITGFLGWRPPGATRDQTYAHLDVRIPDEDKYGLHVLMVKHGKVCDECKAGGGGGKAGSCELRKAFRKGKKIQQEVKSKSEVEDIPLKVEEDV
ncbi:DNA glycosylase [Poronia punctata]|nr:DNA glycosylase [Poronia punctata]